MESPIQSRIKPVAVDSCSPIALSTADAILNLVDGSMFNDADAFRKQAAMLVDAAIIASHGKPPQLFGDCSSSYDQVSRKFENAVNELSLENGSGTPDFIIGRFIADAMLAINRMVTDREKWYGRGVNTIGTQDGQIGDLL